MDKLYFAILLVLFATLARAEQKVYPVEDARYWIDSAAPQAPWQKRLGLRRVLLGVSGKSKKDRHFYDTAFVAELKTGRLSCANGRCQQAGFYLERGTLYAGVELRRGGESSAELLELGKVNADDTVDFAGDTSVSALHLRQQCSRKERKAGCREFESIAVSVTVR